MKRYNLKIKGLSNEYNEDFKDVSKEYIQFKKEMIPSLSNYERLAKIFSFKIKLAEKDRKKLQKDIDTAHIDLSPEEVASFSISSVFLVLLIGLLLFFAFYVISGKGIDEYLFGPAGLFLFLVFLFSLFVGYYTFSYPSRMAKLWKLKASSQMVPCILYVVIYMKHTSNLERAIAFAAKHLDPPLSLDLKKIFWDVETGKYSTIKESLDEYLKIWQDDAVEFVESFHLIESSLYEPSEARRIAILEKSLQVILDGVYEKMLVFSREIRSPLTNLYMLGIVLPTLAIALVPLASALLGDILKWYHVFIIFNLVIPFFVFYLTTQILLKRPGGYGQSEILEKNPDYPLYKSKRPYIIAGLICFPILLIGLLPFLFQIPFFLETLNLQPDYNLGVFGINLFKDTFLFDFRELQDGKTITTLNQLDNAKRFGYVGPFGLVALLLSLLIPLSVSMFFIISFNLKTKRLIKAREDTKQLELEFTNSLFQLGNRLGDGTPAEIAFLKVAESNKGLKTENFFRRVSLNLHQAGFPLEGAIFDSHRGAILFFPSPIIATSMRILLESVKKGLNIAAESLMSISEYIKNINKVTQRMNDLLAEVVSDMKSNMVFLAPLLAGTVIGLSAMITFILSRLDFLFKVFQEGGGLGVGFDLRNILEIFQITKIIPPYYLQIAVGFYIIE
ncbi:MAG: hypothetical protein QXJ28_02700, partial [Candidatus Pacearchaeota archaeon]